MGIWYYVYGIRYTVTGIRYPKYTIYGVLAHKFIRYTVERPHLTVPNKYTVTAVYTVNKKHRIYDIRLLPKSGPYPIPTIGAKAM